MKGNSKLVVALAVLLLLGAIYYFAIDVAGKTDAVGAALAFAAGLTMIVLPCTLPLVFVIVPLSAGKGYKKGIIMALLFGLGLTITISLYGIVVSQLGGYLGLDNFTRMMFLFAGIFAYIFGFSELGLLPKSLIPSVEASVPQWILKQADYIKAFLMGLFLGNAGIGCPNPAFYVLLTYIATVGDAFTGFSLGFIHGLGRATPLILLAVLGMLGIQATEAIVKRREQIQRWTGWGLVLVGAFLFIYGLFGMEWWEKGPIHDNWNKLIASVFPNIAETEDHDIAEGIVEDSPVLLPWGLLFVLVLAAYALRRWKHDRSKGA